MVHVLKLKGSLHKNCSKSPGVDYSFLSLSLPPVSLAEGDKATLESLGRPRPCSPQPSQVWPERGLKSTNGSLEKLHLTDYSSSHSEGVRLNFFSIGPKAAEKREPSTLLRKASGRTALKMPSSSGKGWGNR